MGQFLQTGFLEMLTRIVLVLSGLSALSTTPAFAADGDTRAVANAYSIMLEQQFFAWHIWTTGVSRLDDGTLFGLCSIVLAMAFGVSGLGIILFKEHGLGFRSGWVLATPAIIVSMIVFTMFRPYPSSRDIIPMFIVSALGGLMVLFMARLAKGSVTQVVEGPAKKNHHDGPVDDRRLKMATRAPTGAKRAY